VALVQQRDDGGLATRGWSGESAAPPDLADLAPAVHDVLCTQTTGVVGDLEDPDGRTLAIKVAAPDGPLALIACFGAGESIDRDGVDVVNLLVDSARSLELALERETSERSHREATALRRSQELQRQFLSRLSHELRTPLTAIHGYADSLLQTDVTWDEESQSRFLTRIAGESARLGRLVTDLLDVSAIESNVMRMQRDWCDVELVIDAARACLPLEALGRVTVDCDELPPVWADHDRLEQVLVNLMDNAVRHNPGGTQVCVRGRALGPDRVEIMVSDDGIGMPPGAGSSDGPHGAEGRHGAAGSHERRSTAGAGLGLSIARAIVAAHGGTLRLDSSRPGTWWRIELPVGGRGERDGAELTTGAVGDG
jgi:signal transduction histidine kinase